MNFLTLDHILLLVIIFFGLSISMFVLVAVVISAINYEESPVQNRLLAIKEYADAEMRERLRMNKGPFDDLFEALITFSEPVSKWMFSNVSIQQKTKSLLTEAGLPDTETHVWRFLAIRVAVGFVLGGLLFITSLLIIPLLSINLGALIVGFLLGSMGCMFFLKVKGKKRKEEIRYRLPDTLDLMVVCVEAGLGVDAAMQRVAEETETMAPEISHEFKRLMKELNAGIARGEAFQNLSNRAGVDELKSLCAMIIQADKLGTSIADTLRIYADDMRTKKRQQAEELAAKASIKMTFPLVLFIFPPLFIVLMGPTVIKALEAFK